MTSFLLGGIWNHWANINTREEKLSAVVITTAANPLMAKIHNSKERMPFILDTSEIHRWLDPCLQKDDILHAIKPYDENKMKAHTISRSLTSFKRAKRMLLISAIKSSIQNCKRCNKEIDKDTRTRNITAVHLLTSRFN
jgi:putative SOS response-associated peptidase YedK